ncbi:MAG: hypothetical protein K1X81_04280 [Bacteroidia bacterium]|nr:hypothetical protein [Bacteroidia bacterium]
MIITLILLVVNFVLFCEAGLLLFLIGDGKTDYPVSLITLAGMAGVNLLLCLLHFIIPVNIAATGIVFALLATGFTAYKNEHFYFYKNLLQQWKQTSGIQTGTFMLMALLLSFNVASRPMAFDTGSYHLQAIAWNEKYAIVPGLANLIRQLGFNSSWYVLQAFSGFSFTGIQTVYPLNGLLLLLFAAYLIPEKKETAVVHYYKVIALGCCLILSIGKYAGEVTADFPVIILISWTFLLLVQTSSAGNLASQTPATFLVFILPVYLITIKISAVPVLLISLYVWMQKNTAAKIRYAGLAGLFAVVWLAGNIILSGYLVFPAGGIDFFTVDWKVPDLLIRDENYSITGWGRGPYHPVEQMATMPLSGWFPIWLREQKMVNWLFTGMLVVLIFITRKSIRNQLRKTTMKVLTATTGAGIIFWFVNVPDFRFVYGYLIPVCCATGALFISETRVLAQFNYSFIKPAFGFTSAGLLVLLVMMRWPQREHNGIWLHPVAYPNPVLKNAEVSQTQTVRVATWEQKCWDAPLPCTCEYYEGLQPRGNSWQQGFRIKEGKK